MKNNVILCVIMSVSSSLAPLAWAHQKGDAGNPGLHFAHPLVTESPSPDTKVRFDYLFENSTGEEKSRRNTLQFGGEYAFSRSLSVELTVPYSFLNPDKGSSQTNLDSIDVSLKYANFSFEDSGLLLGGGIGLGLPTGDTDKGIGSDHVLDVEPFLDAGYQSGPWETVAMLAFGIPTNENGANEADWELAWNVSVLNHLSPRVELLMELHGKDVVGGQEGGFDVVNISPGVKFQPTDNPNLKMGTSVTFPLSQDKDFYVQSLFSIFYHY